MIKYNKFSFTENEKTTSDSYLAMIRQLFRGFGFEEADTLRSQMNGYLNDRITEEYDNVEFTTDNETDWLELLGVLVDKFDDLMLDVVLHHEVELSMPLDENK